jgi:hypothetical protein
MVKEHVIAAHVGSADIHFRGRCSLLRGLQMLGDQTKLMMLYSEDEARAKLCLLQHARCCAPDCIAWAASHRSVPSAGLAKRGYCVLRVDNVSMASQGGAARAPALTGVG